MLACVCVASCSYDAPASQHADAPAVDAASDAIDAPIDAMIDASAFTCNVTGIQCPGGQPLRKLACGQPEECWVGCRDGDVVAPGTAEGYCEALSMHLGAFDSAADEQCVRTVLDGAIILGITQLAGQLTPKDGWIRIADGMPATYFHWDVGQPGDPPTLGEQGEAQCAFSGSGGNWHDVSCNNLTSARWTCRR